MGSSADGWPAALGRGEVRWARTSSRYDETVAFYRDLVGLPVVGEFTASFGEDGTIFGLPDTRTQMEIVRSKGGHAAGEWDQLVLYLPDAAAVEDATARLRDAGAQRVAEPHPYWAANGGVAYVDPDGREVVFVPWVYGRDRREAASLEIGWYDGDRQELRALFHEAEDSDVQLDSYVDTGRLLVARDGDIVVGLLLLVDTSTTGEVEIKNMAVAPHLRGRGVGRRLLDVALDAARTGNVTRVTVATGGADVGNLRFYQRCGFRLTGVEPDAFTPDTGYPDPIVIDGIPLRDRVWLARSP